jgi:hypothetical protein
MWFLVLTSLPHRFNFYISLLHHAYPRLSSLLQLLITSSILQIQTFDEWRDCKAFCRTVQIIWSTDPGNEWLNLYTTSLIASSTSVDFIEADGKIMRIELHTDFFVGYLTTLLISKYVKPRMKRWLTKEEFKRIWMEIGRSLIDKNSTTSLEWLRKTAKNFTQNCQCSCIH